MSKKNHFQESIRVAISLFFVLICAYLLRDKWKRAVSILRNMDFCIFGLVLFLFIIINLIAASRLYLVLRIQKVGVPIHKVLYLNFVGLFFNLFLPSSLGGDAVKAYYLSKNSGTTMKIVSSIVIDRLLGLSGVICVALSTLPFFVRLYSDPQLVISVSIVSI